MLRNKSLNVHSRSNSTSDHGLQSKPSFRTLLKRRNDTISSSQLYEILPTSLSKSQSRILTQSQVLIGKENEKERTKQLDIRDYVKTMGDKREGEMDKN